MKRISFRDIGLRYSLSPYEKPVIYVNPGETILIEVEDASSGQIRKEEDLRERSKVPFGNPLVGPIYINGAKPGESIIVSIKDIKPTIDQGAIYSSEFNEKYLCEFPILRFMGASFPYKTKICKIVGSTIFFDGLKIPYRPMIGTIGTAPYPEVDCISSSMLPGRHGGNMDLPDVCPGSKVYLPVFHEGALLYVGDAHAIQGDGEIFGTAIEMPAEIVLEVNISKESLSWPRIENEDEIMCVATSSAGRSLEDAIKMSFLELAAWIEKRYGINRLNGLMLCSLVGKIRLGNLWTVAAKIEKKYLQGFQ